MVSNKIKTRMDFVKFWADYMKKTPNRVWSKQQADLIDSQIKNADISRELYLKMKNAVKKS